MNKLHDVELFFLATRQDIADAIMKRDDALKTFNDCLRAENHPNSDRCFELYKPVYQASKEIIRVTAEAVIKMRDL